MRKILSLADLRQEVKSTRAEIMAKKKETEESIEKAKQRYSTDVAESIIRGLNEGEANYIGKRKNDVKEALLTLKAEKIARLNEYLGSAPTEKELRTLQALQMRKHKPSAEELEAVINNFGNGYQALQLLAETLEGLGVYLPINDATDLRGQINIIFDKLAHTVECIDKSADYLQYSDMEVLSDSENSFVATMIAGIDSDYRFTELPPAKTLYEELTERLAEIKNSKDSDELPQGVKIQKYLDENADIIKTDLDRDREKQEVINNGVRLINLQGV